MGTSRLGALAGCTALCATILALAIPTAAQSNDSGPTGTTGISSGSGTLALSASTAETGYVGLTVSGASSSAVALSEVPAGGGPPAAITTLRPLGGSATLAHAAEWTCAQMSRTFEATETDADGNSETAVAVAATPPCTDRVAARLSGTRLHRDHPVNVELTDTWGLGGLSVAACIDARTQRCRDVALRSGRAAAVARLHLGSARHPLLDLSDPYQNIALRLNVLASRPVLLATGDSEMQILDGYLAADLAGPRGARVVADARQGTAISTPFLLNWPAHAVAQVDNYHPDIVAMFLGGNEGFALGGVNCCSVAWSHQYALKVAGMMRTYLQQGAAAVYWFLIPTPSKPAFVNVVDAVDRGIVLAAAQFPQGVHVFNLPAVFSPNGRYIDTLGFDGKTITVHEPDGFHLSAAADTIVAKLFLARLRRAGLTG